MLVLRVEQRSDCNIHAGAVEVATPLLMPKRADISESAVVLMDRTGLLVSLPFDPVQPFCRMVARERITQLKRYHIGKVCKTVAFHQLCR